MALPEVVTEEPVGLFLDGDGDEVEEKKEESDVKQSILDRIDTDAQQVLHGWFKNKYQGNNTENRVIFHGWADLIFLLRLGSRV